MREALGEFEHMVLVASVQLKGDVYGVPIVDEIHRRTGRRVSNAAVYVALRRLEQRGLITSWMSQPTGERGGKARRCVKISSQGVKALRDARQAMNQMWRGLDAGLKGIR